MKTFILKFTLGGKKQSCRVIAHDFRGAADTARIYVQTYLRGKIISLTECPIQGGGRYRLCR